MNKNNIISCLMVAIIFIGSQPTCAQETTRHLPLIATVFNNGTFLPGNGELGIFSVPIHPGISLGTEFRYNKNVANELFQTAKLSYHYHRYVQHSLQLFSEFGYRRHFKGRFDASPRLGIGYLHSIPDAQIFEKDSSGEYQKKNNWGRAQFMTSIAAEIGYEIFTFKEEPARVFIAYQFTLQMPFVKKYVPLMPNSAFHIGIALPFWTIKKQ